MSLQTIKAINSYQCGLNFELRVKLFIIDTIFTNRSLDIPYIVNHTRTMVYQPTIVYCNSKTITLLLKWAPTSIGSNVILRNSIIDAIFISCAYCQFKYDKKHLCIGLCLNAFMHFYLVVLFMTFGEEFSQLQSNFISKFGNVQEFNLHITDNGTYSYIVIRCVLGGKVLQKLSIKLQSR